jgi:hypothetical protein
VYTQVPGEGLIDDGGVQTDEESDDDDSWGRHSRLQGRHMVATLAQGARDQLDQLLGNKMPIPSEGWDFTIIDDGLIGYKARDHTHKTMAFWGPQMLTLADLNAEVRFWSFHTQSPYLR